MVGEGLKDQKACALVLWCGWAGTLWRILRVGRWFGLRFESVAEELSVDGASSVNFCLCGRWISRGCWEKQGNPGVRGLDGFSLGEV